MRWSEYQKGVADLTTRVQERHKAIQSLLNSLSQEELRRDDVNRALANTWHCLQRVDEETEMAVKYLVAVITDQVEEE